MRERVRESIAQKISDVTKRRSFVAVSRKLPREITVFQLNRKMHWSMLPNKDYFTIESNVFVCMCVFFFHHLVAFIFVPTSLTIYFSFFLFPRARIIY